MDGDKASGSQKVFMGVGGLLAALYMIVGVLVWLGVGNPGDYPRFVWAIVGVAAGAIILLGLWADRRSPLLGGILVLVGALPLAILFFWAIVPLILVILMVLSWARARLLARRVE